jgi:hypothetical protein
MLETRCFPVRSFHIMLMATKNPTRFPVGAKHCLVCFTHARYNLHIPMTFGELVCRYQRGSMRKRFTSIPWACQRRQTTFFIAIVARHTPRWKTTKSKTLANSYTAPRSLLLTSLVGILVHACFGFGAAHIRSAI